MRNKFNYGELVKVSGIGKEFGEVNNKLGFVIQKDDYYDDYYIEIIFGNKDWFNENSLERILEERKNKIDKYQIRLCTTKEGYELIKLNLKAKEPISNNKFKKIDIYRKFERNSNSYIIIGWNSVFWPVSNKSIKILEETLKEFKAKNIPFQYVILNENIITDIRIIQFFEKDENVNIFIIERKIKMRKENNRNDSSKNIKCNE